MYVPQFLLQFHFLFEENCLKVVQSFYIASRACVRMGNDVSEWFQVNVGLRQGCVMSPWVFY